MRCDIITIFPQYLEPLNLSLPGQAQRKGLLDINVHDLRDFTRDHHRTVDDTPYGGGAGMVMKPQPWWEALEHVRGLNSGTPTLIVPGPGGEVLNQKLARELAEEDWLIFACGRYEGIDERVYEAAADVMPVRVISLGDYVLNGGEVAVLAMIEASARLLPGFMGNADSLVEESHEDGLLEYPVYTKPASWKGREIPEVLLSGDHGKTAEWRHQQRLERTAARRPDLLHPSALAGSGEFEISPARPSDSGEVLTLHRACALPGASWTHVARSGGRVVGVFSAILTDEAWVIRDVAVVPDLWGQGIGRQLLEAAEGLRPATCRKILVVGHAEMGAAAADRVIRGLKKAKYRPVGSSSWEKRSR